MNIIERLVRSIPLTDPEEARQQRLLNILLAIMLGTAVGQEIVFMFCSFVLGIALPPLAAPEEYWAGALFPWSTVLAVVVVYFVNRYGSRRLARFLFVFILAAGVYANTPDNWVLATLTYALSIAVFISSFLLRSYASFIVAVVCGVATTIAGIALGVGVYVTPLFLFFALATLSQIIARNLEHTLDELRILNLELDQRVQDRTRELAESLSKTEAILESTADGIIVFDNGGKATVANPAVAGLLARPVYEIVGSDIAALMGEDVSPDDKEMIAEFLHGREMQEPSVKFAWGKRTLSASAAPVRLESGEDLGTVAVFRDFTREAEIDRMKSTFVSLASHELRTPLNAILGYSEMLGEGVYGPLSERQRDAAGRILANTRHMLSLANNLLDRAQIEAGTLMLNVVPFSPANIINEAVSAMEVLARNKGLGLISEIGADLPGSVSGDQHRVSQVVVNLIGNAIKFTEKGTVNVRAYCLDQDHWSVNVSDTGIGIAEEARQYIFEPFRQADESPTRRHGGAGLGLSIVKQLVEMMGGEIRLESEVERGSMFTIILPTVPPVPEERDQIEAGSSL
jgi:PAS domain S-box-containing protein